MRDALHGYEGPPTSPPIDFSKIRLAGNQTLEDAVLSLGDLKKVNSRLADKEYVLRAINDYNLPQMREISNFFFKTSGIYSRLCRHLAYLYRYDWLVVPIVKDQKKKNNNNSNNNNSSTAATDKLVNQFKDVLSYLDAFEPKKNLSDIALKVIKNGCYYGYRIDTNTKPIIQELPIDYCRTRFNVLGRPAIEFQMKYFDDSFKDIKQREQILSLFPDEFAKGQKMYKAGKLPAQFQGDEAGWYLLDVKHAFKFNMNGEDHPFFMAVIPALIDLDDAQALDRKRQAQQIVKIVIQQFPLDKQGELLFDGDEMKELHNNAVQMLKRSIGVDVLSTPADVSVEDLAANNGVTSVDELEKVERTVYNESGTAQNLFNTDGNVALEKSILNDEAAMYGLLLQFEGFLNDTVESFNKQKKAVFKVELLNTTIYNYTDMAKLYKEQTSMGYSKMLPQIALGQSQSAVLASAFFENDVLDLVNVFVPPLSTNTMNNDTLTALKGKKNAGEEKKTGRKELDDDKKSEKTLRNEESMS